MWVLQLEGARMIQFLLHILIRERFLTKCIEKLFEKIWCRYPSEFWQNFSLNFYQPTSNIFSNLCCKKHAHILCRNFGWRICEIFLYGHFVWNFCVMFLCFSSIFITKKVCIFYEENLIENFVYLNCVQILCIVFV